MFASTLILALLACRSPPDDDTASGTTGGDGGTTADANTGPWGETQWVLPLLSGGWSQSLTQVYVNGSALTTGPTGRFFIKSAKNTCL